MKDRRGPATVTGSVRRTRRRLHSGCRSHWEASLSWEGVTEDPEARSLPPAEATTTLEEGKAPDVNQIPCARDHRRCLARAGRRLRGADHRAAPCRRRGQDAVRRPRHDRREGDHEGTGHASPATARSIPPTRPPGPTPTSALDDGAAAERNHVGRDLLRAGLLPDVGSATSSPALWGLAVNFTGLQVGGCQYQVHAGDEVLWAADFFGGPPNYLQKTLLRLEGPGKAVAGAPANVRVSDGTTGAPVAGATVGGAVTGADGIAAVTVGTAGVVRLKAEAPDAVRSNALAVCVSQSGKDDCGLPPPAGVVKDSVAPRALIKGPRDGRHYRRGPRLLAGTASDDVGLTRVKLALRRHERGERCRWWSGHARAVRREGVRPEGVLRHRLERELVLPAAPPARARPLRAGREGVRSRPQSRRALRARLQPRRVLRRPRLSRACRGHDASKAARVRVLLAGKSTSSAARREAPAPRGSRSGVVNARWGLRRRSRRSPRVLRAHRTTYRIRDYGNCSRTDAAAAGQLFVRRIGQGRQQGHRRLVLQG